MKCDLSLTIISNKFLHNFAHAALKQFAKQKLIRYSLKMQVIEVLALKKPEASEASAKWQYIAIGDIDVYYRVQIQQLIISYDMNWNLSSGIVLTI